MRRDILTFMPSQEVAQVKVAVVGHVECAEFALVDHLPRSGEIVHALASWDDLGGGGAVAAVQLAKLAGSCLFITAIGNDKIADTVVPELRRFGVEVYAVRRPVPQRRAFVFVEESGERTITTLGPRLSPLGSDEELPWDQLADCDAVYVTATDSSGVDAARKARQVVATIRAAEAIWEAGSSVDVLVASRNDAGEIFDPGKFQSGPLAVVMTDGPRGGTITMSNGETEEFEAAPLASEPVDSYGAGDSFAAGLTFGLGLGLPLNEAVKIGALCGASNLQGRGPYSGQATAKDLEALDLSVD